LPTDCGAPALPDAFAVFVVSRMWRWKFAALAEGGRAMKLLCDAATQCLVTNTIEALEGDADDPNLRPEQEPQARDRVRGWLRDREWLDLGDGAYLDLILFDVDRLARQQLRRRMPDPPSAWPLRQRRLLETTLARQPENWQGVAITDGNLRAALAVGLDLEIANVPPAFAERLRKRHPFLAVPAGVASAVRPQAHWLTRVRVLP